MVDEFVSGKLQASRSWRGETEKARVVESRVGGGAILDAGCGDGKFLLALDERKWNRTGIDFARQTLELVQARFPSLRLIPGSIESITGLAPGSFDAVTFWHVLEHLPDPGSVLRRAAALLRPNGWLFISLPNLDSLQAALFRRNWYAFDDVPRHLWHFSRRSLDLFLQQSGLHVRGHLFFSRSVSFHCLKHSLVHWSENRFGSRAPYYFLKPALFAFPLLELLTGRYGIMTTVAQKAATDSTD